MFETICEILKTQYSISPEDVLYICPYGSKVYWTDTRTSDDDFVVIVKDNEYFESLQYESRLIDIHIMSLSHYKTLLNMCNIMALEVYFNYDPIKGPKDHLHIEFELDKRNLRKSISAVVSNSWVKAKKKVALDNEDTWIGYKSLFHSMRILDFGIQIAETGKINDYTRASHLWDEILKMSDDGVSFEDIMKHYKPIQNANQTKFRQLAPKE